MGQIYGGRSARYPNGGPQLRTTLLTYLSLLPWPRLRRSKSSASQSEKKNPAASCFKGATGSGGS